MLDQDLFTPFPIVKCCVTPGYDVTLSDAAGFLSKFRHHMIDAFQSNLNGLAYSDLVCLVLDAGDSVEDLKRKLASWSAY
jgi:50S ribosomal subunit-associated GTPase HflX